VAVMAAVAVETVAVVAVVTTGIFNYPAFGH